MKNKVKKGHYVPVSYLRNFANTRDQIRVFDKFYGTRFPSNIDSIACERYFYDLKDEQDGGHVEQSIELELGLFEKHASKVLSSLISDIERGRFSIDGKPTIAQVMAVMLLRTRESRESAQEVFEKLGTQLARETARTLFPEKSEEDINSLNLSLIRDYLPDFHNQVLLNDEMINLVTSILSRHIWVIGVNESDKLLFTSDHPVVRMPHIRNGVGPLVGIASPGIELHFPINSRIEIILLERSFHEKMVHRDGNLLRLNEERVTYSNTLQLIDSFRFVFSEDNNFALARLWREENLDQCRPDKKRIGIMEES